MHAECLDDVLLRGSQQTSECNDIICYWGYFVTHGWHRPHLQMLGFPGYIQQENTIQIVCFSSISDLYLTFSWEFECPYSFFFPNKKPQQMLFVPTLCVLLICIHIQKFSKSLQTKLLHFI